MVRITAPVYSLRASGWMGRGTYAHLGIVNLAYPIGIFPKWLMNSMYYSRLGWCYARRRTWHGCISIAMVPPISKQPNLPHQYQKKQDFAYGVHLWQKMNQETKDYYARLNYPARASGYNRFLHYYLLSRPA